MPPPPPPAARRITVFISPRDLLCPLYRSGRVSLGFPCPTRTRARARTYRPDRIAPTAAGGVPAYNANAPLVPNRQTGSSSFFISNRRLDPRRSCFLLYAMPPSFPPRRVLDARQTGMLCTHAFFTRVRIYSRRRPRALPPIIFQNRNDRTAKHTGLPV